MDNRTQATLKIKSQGDAVKNLQEFLLQQGFKAVGNVDGDFGPKTLAGLKAFQTARGLPVTGEVDAATQERINTLRAEAEAQTIGKNVKATMDTLSGASSAAPASQSTTFENLAKGAQGDKVKGLQQILSSNGFDLGNVDGDFGPKTEAALKAFQTKNNLEVTGTVDSNTVAALSALPPVAATRTTTTRHAAQAASRLPLPIDQIPTAGNTWLSRRITHPDGKVEYDTVREMTKSVRKANPQETKGYTDEQIDDMISVLNNLKDDKGRDCFDKEFGYPVVPPKVNIKLPFTNPITHVALASQVCDEACPPTPPKPKPAPLKPTTPPAAEGPQRVLSQFIPTDGSYEQASINVAIADLLYGDREKRAHASRNGDFDNLAANGRPGHQDGSLATTRKDKDLILVQGDKSHELNYPAPALPFFIDANGRATGVDNSFNRKLQVGARFEQDAQGNYFIKHGTDHKVSIHARRDGQAGAFWTNHEMASNEKNLLNQTSEGVLAQATLAAAEELNAAWRAEATSSPAAAKRSILLNLKTGLHPLVHSVSSVDMPVPTSGELKDRVRGLMQTPGISATDMAYYQQALDVINNPFELKRVMKDTGLLAQAPNPTLIIGLNRVKNEEMIRENYGNSPEIASMKSNLQYPSGNNEPQAYWAKQDTVAAMQEKQAVRNVHALAKVADELSTRTPTKSEIELGTGLSLNSSAQTAASVRERLPLLPQHLANNPRMVEDYAATVASNPGAVARLTTLLYVGSRVDGDNETILGTGGNSRDAARLVAHGLFGKDAGEAVLHDRGNNIGAYLTDIGVWVGNRITFGNVHFDRNMPKGTERFHNAMQQRMNGSPQERAEVLNAITQLSNIAYWADTDPNSPQIATSLMTHAINPRLHETDNGRASSEYTRLAANLDAAGIGTLPYDLMALNYSVGAKVERSTEVRVMQGEQIETHDRSRATAIVNRNARTNGSSAAATVFYTDPARNAQTDAQRAAVLATANSPSLVSQTQTNASLTESMDEASASLLVVKSMASKEPSRAGINYMYNISNPEESNLGRRGREFRSIIREEAFALKEVMRNGTPAQVAQKEAEILASFNELFGENVPHMQKTGRQKEMGYAAHDLRGQVSRNPAASEELAGTVLEGLNNLIASGALTREQIAKIQGIAAVNQNPQEREAALQKYVNANVVDFHQSYKAGAGVDYVILITNLSLAAGLLIKTPPSDIPSIIPPKIPPIPGTPCPGICVGPNG